VDSVNSKPKRENYCSFPFASIFTLNSGEVRMCCDSKATGRVGRQSFSEIWNGDYWKEIRRSFLKDERHPACEVCWKREDRGMVSGRDPHQGTYKVMADCSSDGEQQSFPKRLSIRLGNECNLKCVMCGPSNSTKWFEDMAIYEQYVLDPTTRVRSPQILNEEFLLQSVDEVEELLFLGGEPLMIRSHQKTLEHLIKIGRAPSVTLSYFTNATLINEPLIELWRQFKAIKIRCSIDATGAVYNYIRNPGKWDQVAKTMVRLDECKLPNFDYGISYVYMGINGLELEKLFRWRNSIEWKSAFPVIRPDYCREPVFFPAHLANAEDRADMAASLDRILSELCWHRHETELVGDMKEHLLTTEVSEDERVHQQRQLREYLSKLDANRGLNFRDVLTFKTLTGENSRSVDPQFLHF
jgi:MoaA/NifB/PqqE/SkfB family radical SAM enzyme